VLRKVEEENSRFHFPPQPALRKERWDNPIVGRAHSGQAHTGDPAILGAFHFWAIFFKQQMATIIEIVVAALPSLSAIACTVQIGCATPYWSTPVCEVDRAHAIAWSHSGPRIMVSGSI
jgi:hypothetical protein